MTSVFLNDVTAKMIYLVSELSLVLRKIKSLFSDPIACAYLLLHHVTKTLGTLEFKEKNRKGMHTSSKLNKPHRAEGVLAQRRTGGVLACAAALANLQSHGKLPYI